MIIDSVKAYMAKCPCIADFTRLLVDNLAEGADSFSIESVPSQTVLSTYLDGSTSEQYVFAFVGRLFYSDEVRNNIENSGIFENIQLWLKEQTDKGELPEMDEGLTPTAVEAMTSGYVVRIAGDMETAVYQIQCRLLYERG